MAAVAGSKPPFYERPRWLATVAVVALAGAIWALTGAPTPWQIVKDLTTAKLPRNNTMLVLDASRTMGHPFTGKQTKLDVALSALESFTIPLENEGLALRTFGGSCKKSGRVLVDFGAEHADEVHDASTGLRPRGRSNLVNAVRAAIDDFADGDRFPDDGARRIVVFMGSIDECVGPAAARDIANDIKHSKIGATFKFVGLKLGRKSRQRLVRFEKALGRRAEVAFATTTSELTDVRTWLKRGAGGPSDCADKVDNDGDGSVDGSDPQCDAGDTEAPKKPAGECADKTDNDGDGTIDGDDPECASGTTEAPKQQAGACHDGVDNDGDERIDGADPECATGDSEAPAPVGECRDEIDNDQDSRIDGEDPDCASGTTEAPVEPPRDCDDGMDNDADDRTDNEDPGCAVNGREASG